MKSVSRACREVSRACGKVARASIGGRSWNTIGRAWERNWTRERSRVGASIGGRRS